MSWFTPDVEGLDTPDVPVPGTPPASGPAPAPSPRVPAPQPTPPAGPEPTATPQPTTARTYTRRRRITVLGICALIALTGFIVYPRNGASLALPAFMPEAEAAPLAATIPGPELAQADQANVIATLERDGNLKAFTPVPGGDVYYTHVKGTAIFGRDTGTQCLVYAVVDRAPTVITLDATGYGCTDAGIQAARAELLLVS